MGREVDPEDAETIAPAAGRDDGLGTDGAEITVSAEGRSLTGRVISVSAIEVVVRLPGSFAMDTEVSCRAGDLEATALVVWTRSQGPSVVSGLAFVDAADGGAWEQALG